ncbi:homeobox protein abdominal-A homolog [Copidosoma floridanum]|uniref:homeobox protein abdominal-A homolog n=1 Tax=Copidosoma floridanum TaxID=29053 RepID=UPI0006C9C22A|nr:homeobox protein abdominal-A homolog [Copidosoma floridanum]
MQVQYPEQLDNVAEEHKPQDQETKDQCATRRNRTSYTLAQVTSLEGLFGRAKYLSRYHRILVSQQLKLTEQQVRVWFQNRRKKFKKDYENCPDTLNLLQTSKVLRSTDIDDKELLQVEQPSNGQQEPLLPHHHQQTLIPHQQMQQPMMPQQPMYYPEMQRRPSVHPYFPANQQLGVVLRRVPPLMSSGAPVAVIRASDLYRDSFAPDYASSCRFKLNVEPMHLQQLKQQLYPSVQMIQPQQHQQLQIFPEDYRMSTLAKTLTRV